jgi:hypothetical protein
MNHSASLNFRQKFICWNQKSQIIAAKPFASRFLCGLSRAKIRAGQQGKASCFVE